jgi:hypothetical protein
MMKKSINKNKLQKSVLENIDQIKKPEEPGIPENDPEIIPFEDPFESPSDESPVPGEGP